MTLTPSRLGALLALALTLLLAPRGAEAAGTGVRIGLGADAWLRNRGGLFSLLVGVDTRLAGPLSIGGRFGAFLATAPDDVGVPLDLVLRASFRNAYVEAMAGPHVFFADDPVHAHAAFGFGLQNGPLSFGLEVGYLEPEPVLGVRLGYRL